MRVSLDVAVARFLVGAGDAVLAACVLVSVFIVYFYWSERPVAVRWPVCTPVGTLLGQASVRRHASLIAHFTPN